MYGEAKHRLSNLASKKCESGQVAQDTMEAVLGERAGNHEVGVQQNSSAPIIKLSRKVLLRCVGSHRGTFCSDECILDVLVW